jgi:hypothetical protein
MLVHPYNLTGCRDRRCDLRPPVSCGMAFPMVSSQHTLSLLTQSLQLHESDLPHDTTQQSMLEPHSNCLRHAVKSAVYIKLHIHSCWPGRTPPRPKAQCACVGGMRPMHMQKECCKEHSMHVHSAQHAGTPPSCDRVSPSLMLGKACYA